MIMSTKDEVIQRELFVIKMLRKGYSRKYVAAKLVENYGLAERTAENLVQEIGSQLNKSLEALQEDAASYIYNILLSTIDETLDDKDRKNRLKALELLAKVCKVGSPEKQDININFGFSFDEDDRKSDN